MEGNSFICLKKGKKFLSSKKYFLIKSGKVVTREILTNDRYIGYELHLSSN